MAKAKEAETGQKISVVNVVPKGLPKQIRKMLEGCSTVRQMDLGKDIVTQEQLIKIAREETGFEAKGRFIELGELKQAGGKIVHAWALEMDVDPARLESNSFFLEWPRGSGVIREFPEVDRGAWFDLAQARIKLVRGQLEFIDRLLERLELE